MPPNTRISDGLRQRERQQNDSIPLSHLSGAPKNLSELKATAASAMQRQQRLSEMTAGIAKTLERFEADKRAEFAELGKSHGDNGTVNDNLGDDRRRKMLADTMKAKRREVLNVGADQRAALKRELDAMRDQVQAVSDLYADPVAYLKRSTWGSDKADLYRRDLSAAGPRELENAMQTAALTGNRELAAAALSRLDSLAKNQRDSVRINRRELAESLVADEVRDAKAAIMRAEIAAESAALEIARVEGREVPASRRMSLGMRRRELQALIGEDESADDPSKPPEADDGGYTVPAEEHAAREGGTWVS